MRFNFKALFLFLGSARTLSGFPSPTLLSKSHSHGKVVSSRLSSTEKDGAAQDALERTAAHLQKLQGSVAVSRADPDAPPDPLGVEREKIYQEYLQNPANTLKQMLKERKLMRTGRKPDLARRLAVDDLRQLYGDPDKDALPEVPLSFPGIDEGDGPTEVMAEFSGIPLSTAAGAALVRANILKPSPIQAAAIPALSKGEPLVLHAETGSGKTLAYLLHITELLWKSKIDDGRFLVLTPTRELAAQVAGIASVLSPPGSVRMVANPSNLMTDGQKDRGEGDFGGRVDAVSASPRLFIGSAKSVLTSLYGDGKMPASPTPKPLAMEFLQSVRCVVLDEVDRLLNVKKSRADKQYKKVHERPAATLVAALMRLSLGKTQVVAASATVGRPLKRELSRVMGLPPQECPRVVVAASGENEQEESVEAIPNSRTVKIPSGVQHYVVEADGQSDGKMLTMAYKSIQSLNHKPRRMLMVLSKGFGLNPKNVVGALRHFKCKPEPQNLLDRLEAEGTDDLIEAHRQVSGASGVGEKALDDGDNSEYLLVCGEDSVRGLHLDGLDIVIVVGRPNGVDEYTHIAGRTGRAGKGGTVINIVETGNARSIGSWGSMLGVDFEQIGLSELSAL